MPLPDHLERLKDIPIDTLGLSESTQAVLKFYGLLHVLDCMAVFHRIAPEEEAGNSWPRLGRLLFGEVRTALIAAGYWDLLMDAETWQVFKEHDDTIDRRRIVRWQGRDQDLYEIAFEQLDLSDPPPKVQQRCQNLGICMDYFLALLGAFPENWAEIGKYEGEAADTPFKYLFGLVLPRLMEQGYWRLVEDYVDDFMEDIRFRGGYRLRRGR